MTTPALGAILNASPLIFLGKLGELDLLPDAVATTHSVLEEIRAGDPAEHSEIDLINLAVGSSQIDLVEGDVDTLPTDLGGLHTGEASVLAAAIETETPQVIIDDRVAIRAAKAMGLHPISTPFQLLRRCREGHTQPEVFERHLDRLLDLGYFLSGKLYRRLLEAASTANP